MSVLYESCAGCGAETPSERCFGCFHDFGSGLKAPSNANTSGLDFYGYRAFNAGIGVCHLVAKPGLNDTNPEPLVTAASAQARIAELEAEIAEIIAERSRRSVAWQRSEARADRLAKALEEIRDADPYHVSHPIARAALQHETQQ